MDNKRTVSMEPHSVGDLLTEVSRAHLHGGLPSTMIKRLKDGVDKFCTECSDQSAKQLATHLSEELGVMYDEWKAKENDFYSM